MGRFKAILDGAAKKTDAELASQISSLTRLKDEEINALAPHPPDKEKLLKLLEIVDSATDENEAAAALQENLAALSGIVVRVVKTIL
jgi:hypothetical protein